tara:strand:+ start:382 stop:897 length:516 start_codon:yes stop_codon:yes gene_type:complete
VGQGNVKWIGRKGSLFKKNLMITQMKVRGLMIDPHNSSYVVLLQCEESQEVLPIWVGKPEASAISCALEGLSSPRPMTHDLMKTLVDSVDAKVLSASITDLRNNTYYAKVHIAYGNSFFAIDSRPSDAIAFALRAEAPIFVSEDVIQKHDDEEVDRWLENLKPEDFGKYEV